MVALIRRMEPAEDQGKLELKAQFVELRAKGLSYAKIAKKLKVSKATLANWSQELEAEIASRKAMELEALMEEFWLLKEGRIRLLGTILAKLKKEAEERDLSTLPTDKLLELLLKYQEELKAEFVEVRPLSEAEIASLKG